MKIYVTHSTGFDFKERLYKPLRESELNKTNEITLPHEKDGVLFDSKNFMKECDLIIAEVSFPSTGQGIELGWADSYGKPILAVYQSGTKPTSALKAVTNEVLEYKNEKDLIDRLRKYLSDK